MLDGGVIHVADTGNHRVQLFRHDGTFLGQFGSYGSGPGELSSPQDIDFGFFGLFVVDTGNHRI